MPPAAQAAASLRLIWGDDEFAVKQRARQLFTEWCQQAGGFDHEIIDAAAANSDEALRALARLREALQTLPFFGSQKVIWFRDCSFLADDRTGESAAVTAALAEFAQELKAFRWTGVRLLISAGRVDKRRAFYKTIEAIGQTEEHAGLSFEDNDWVSRAEEFARREAAARQKRFTDVALGELVAAVGPNLRLLSTEIEKLALFVGDRAQIEPEDVAALVTRSKHARAFALAEALGDRDLARALRTLDNELWEIRLKIDRDKSPIGLLYGLIAKVRTLLLLKELIRLGHVQANADYPRLKAQLGRLSPELLPADKRYNPAAMHPFVVSKALPQTRHYTTAELIRALEVLLQCNQRLVSRNLDDALVLQQALVSIIGRPARPGAPVPTPAGASERA